MSLAIDFELHKDKYSQATRKKVSSQPVVATTATRDAFSMKNSFVYKIIL